MMKAPRRVFRMMLVAFAGASLLAPLAARGGEVIDVGDRRELFIDGHLIERLDNARLTAHEPRYEGKVVMFDKPWEGKFSFYSTVIKDGATYRLYYRGLPKAEHDTGWESLCYAESDDGIHWRKPNLGVLEVKGVKKNNVIITNSEPGTHSFSPFLDAKPGVPDAQRFKALGLQRTPGNQDWCLAAFVSADGKHWTRFREEPVILNDTDHFAFDSQNVAFWSQSEEKYIAYFRTWKDGIRRISRATSDNFIRWSSSQLMEYRRNGEPAPIHHLYINQTHPYFRAPHIYIATAARFMPGRRVLTDAEAKAIGVNPNYFRDTSDSVLMTSRGGAIYDCTFMNALIRPGIGARNWVSRTNYAALNVVQTGPTEMSIYVNRDYAQSTAHLARYSLRLDGFGSARGPYEGGEVITKPLRFKGGRLSINYSTSAAGSVRIEIQDEAGNALPGYALADCREIIGDEIERAAAWKNGNDVGNLAGKPVRLRFVLRDADLYAFRFAE
ncbi:MAG: hypothetical protein OSA93_18330 [Akkermansiaceae bacterium]|nr:hypothetical protein [Akkermansiaceae bacterium]